MISATIKNVVKDVNGIRVFYDFSDGDQNNRMFPAEYSKDQIIQDIKLQTRDKNELIDKVASYQDLVGLVIQ